MWRKPVVVVLAVLILLAVLPMPFTFNLGVTRNYSEYTTSSTSDLRGNRFRSYSRIAIVSPPTTWLKRGVQRRIASQLEDRLSKWPVAYDTPVLAQRWTRGKPTVRLFRSEEDAMKWKPEAVFFVRLVSWKSLPTPLHRRWSAVIRIGGGPPGTRLDPYLSTPEWDKDYNYGFLQEFTVRGYTTGLFSSNYPASYVAKEITEDVIEGISKRLSDDLSRERDEAREAKKAGTH